MVRKEKVLLAFSTAALLLAMTNLALVIAPPEQTEGWKIDYQRVGDWNWGISSNATGHWIWIPGMPPRYVFDEWIDQGKRGGGIGVDTEGPLKFWWWDDNLPEQYIETSGNDETISYTGQTHHVNCTAKSGFVNWWGQHWEARVSSLITS